MKKLKPCPFCGDEDPTGPTVAKMLGDCEDSINHQKEYYWIECVICRYSIDFFDATLEEVIKLWNTRS